MSEERECPKCGDIMTQGILQKRGEYGNSPAIWAPIDEPRFSLKDSPSSRFEIDMFRCKSCGYVEFYAERPA